MKDERLMDALADLTDVTWLNMLLADRNPRPTPYPEEGESWPWNIISRDPFMAIEQLIPKTWQRETPVGLDIEIILPTESLALAGQRLKQFWEETRLETEHEVDENSLKYREADYDAKINLGRFWKVTSDGFTTTLKAANPESSEERIKQQFGLVLLEGYNSHRVRIRLLADKLFSDTFNKRKRDADADDTDSPPKRAKSEEPENEEDATLVEDNTYPAWVIDNDRHVAERDAARAAGPTPATPATDTDEPDVKIKVSKSSMYVLSRMFRRKSGEYSNRSIYFVDVVRAMNELGFVNWESSGGSGMDFLHARGWGVSFHRKHDPNGSAQIDQWHLRTWADRIVRVSTHRTRDHESIWLTIKQNTDGEIDFEHLELR